MQLTVIFTLVVIFIYQTVADDLDTCKCWTNYKATKEDAKVYCLSTLSLATAPCNIPEAPKCRCEKAPILGFMTDVDGTWCLGYGPGNKWACENVEEWNKYEADCKDEVHCIPNSHKKV